MLRLNACASKMPIITLDMIIAMVPFPLAYQHIYAIKIVPNQHAYEETKRVNSSSQRRFRIHRNYRSK